MTKILGIDPGYDRLGIAIVEKNEGKESLVYSSCFTTSSKETFHERLRSLGNEVEGVIKKYGVDALAIETLIFNSNQKTATKVSETRGAIIFLALQNNLKVYEYTPLQIKIALTGYGRSTKDQVTFMVKNILSLGGEKKLDDEYDAIAAALTCSASMKTNDLAQ